MPTLPSPPEVPSGPERVREAAQRVGAAFGATSHFRFRLILWLGITGACVALSPIPLNVVGAVAILLAVIEVSRNR